MENNKSIHDGHRQRLKNKFLENGFLGFDRHNILELLLFYSIPRRDTNEIAHRLLNRFGSLKNVFNACTSERVNTLCIVAHYAQMLVSYDQLLDDEVLQRVCVLVLIHQDIVKSFLVIALYLRVLIKE